MGWRYWIDDNDETENHWNQGNSRVVKGSHISSWTEGDQNDDYSFEVVYFSNVGYQDSIQDSGNEESETDSDYDWLRITMVSHGDDNMTEHQIKYLVMETETKFKFLN